MTSAAETSRRPAFGLSARLLVMTIIFVMIAEVLIFVPSICRYRQSHLREHIAKAHVAVLALQATPDQMVSETLEEDLLFHAEAYGVVLRDQTRKKLILSKDMPPAIDLTVHPFEESILFMISETFRVLAQSENRIIRVIGPSPRVPGATIELILDETPMRELMYAFAGRILALSIIISLITAGLVYLTLQWLMVRPILRLTDNMIDFRNDPENPNTTMIPSGRSDEIGLAERELAAMQTEVRETLQQNARLATLGTAVAKINHDLRNTLSTAVIASDALANSSDPTVRRMASRLFAAIDRAVTICTQSLRLARGERQQVEVAPMQLDELIAEVVADVSEQNSTNGGVTTTAQPSFDVDVPADASQIEADRGQMARVLTNLLLNAVQSGASRVDVHARNADDDRLIIEISDNGPGIPSDVVTKLFTPFAASSRTNGTGLGLAISREILRAHRGDLVLAATGADGTTFQINLPKSSVRVAA